MTTIRILIVGITCLCGCGILEPKEVPDDPYLQIARDVAQKPIPPERSQQLMEQTGGDFVYGPGLGEAMMNVGATVVFPPYGLYILGNTILDMAGYEQLRVSNMLPTEETEAWDGVYESVVSGPGRTSAAVAGREYRSKELIIEDSRKLLEEISREQQNAPHVEKQ